MTWTAIVRPAVLAAALLAPPPAQAGVVPEMPAAPDTGAGYRAPPNSHVSSAALEQKIDELIAWIERNSGFSHIDRPPILFVSQEELAYVFAFPNAWTSNEVMALYADGVLLLPDTFRLGRDDFMLLHELVHHAQKRSGREYACNAEKEKEAYELQRRYVEETGRGIEPDPLFAALQRCDIREMPSADPQAGLPERQNEPPPG